MVEVRTETTPFTVKWEYKLDSISRSRIIEADQIHTAFDDRPANEPGHSAMLGVYTVASQGLVVLGDPSDGSSSMALGFGEVYVMNRDGKTVAKYKLADPEAKTDQAERPRIKTVTELAREAGAR